MPKLKIDLNNEQTIKDLLQEAYNLANEQIIQTQNEINKMANATRLQDTVMDEKAKYGKIINDYLKIKDSAIRAKIEIAKLLSDIIAHNGNMTEAGSTQSFDFTKIKQMVKDMHNNEKESTKTIELRKK